MERLFEMTQSPTPYMTQETARALLAESQRRTAVLREARPLFDEFVRCGWSVVAAREMMAIHVRMQLEQKQ